MADAALSATSPPPGDYDYEDPGENTKRKAAASLREDRIRETESAILSTQGGREWIWSILTRLHVWEQRIAVTASDYENGFMAGEREAGIQMMRRFAKVSPQQFGMMIAENDS